MEAAQISLHVGRLSPRSSGIISIFERMGRTLVATENVMIRASRDEVPARGDLLGSVRSVNGDVEQDEV